MAGVIAPPTREGRSALRLTLFLPDFTARHQDGREALVEIVGLWTPEYLQAKLQKLRAARVDVAHDTPTRRSARRPGSKNEKTAQFRGG